MRPLAKRVGHLTPSTTLAITAKAKALQAQGVDVCNLGAGEPDFDTPEHIKRAAQEALARGETKYGPVAGLPALRDAIAQKTSPQYQAENVLVTAGGKHSLYNLMMALLDPGDEVVIPTPYWVSYPEMVKLAGGVPVFVETLESEGFQLTPEQLEAVISPRTKLLIINSPSNPTGMVYTPRHLEALAQVVVEHDLWVVSDEIYGAILYDGAIHRSIGSLGPEIFARTLISSGFSKAYSMTGWRMGYLLGPTDVIQAAAAIQSHSTSNVTTFAQYGALAAITGGDDCIAPMLQAFKQRRDYLYQALSHLPGVTCLKPEGAFYLFPNISATGMSSNQFTLRLLEEARVAVIPGVAFGADHHIRISYATDLETLKKSVARMEQFLGVGLTSRTELKAR
jgi:aspartate aminotransferase